MTTEQKYAGIRYFAFTLELLLLFTLQQTPGLLPRVFESVPLLLLPMTVCIAMVEECVPAAVFGFAGGLLTDLGGNGALGFHAALLMALCFILSMLCRNLIRTNLFSCLLAGLVAGVLVFLLHWFFFFLLPGYDFPLFALVYRYLPRLLYTFVFTLPLYFLNKLLFVALHKHS